VSAQVFEKSSVPPLDGSTDFSFDLWEKIRDRGIEPQFRSNYASDEQGRREFLEGARMMGFELIDLDDADELARLDAMEPQRFPLQPQQLQLSDILDSRHRTYVVEMPRRASKSTTIFLKLLGRCIVRRNYLVTFSAQNGVASGRLFDDWIERLNELWPEDKSVPPWLRDQTPKPRKVSRHVALFGEELLPDEMLDELETPAAPRPFKARVSPSARDLTIKATGSKIRVIKTAASAYRGLAADVSWLDEAQEIDPEEGGKIIAGIRPLQDTRAARGGSPATIVSGTAGDGRVGVFWSYVNRLRSADASMGGIDFCAPEDTPWDVVENEDAAMDLLCRVHPGVGTLTTREIMLDTYREPEFGLPQWSREYLSLWPETYGSVVIDSALWTKAALSAKAKRPDRVAFGLDIRPGGAAAAIVAAWRSPRGTAYVEVVEHRSGTKWLAERMQELSRTYRGSTIAYDDIAEGKATFTESERLTPKPRLKMQTYRETAAGCVQFLRDLDRGTLRHADQVGLNAAVAVAGRRETRTDQGVWLWTPAEQGADITCLVAATRALRNWDQHFARSTGTNRSVMGA
jgi:hypothetical protein